MKKAEWTLSELAQETGLPARTIRYYIARGLVPGPHVAGRSALYGTGHVQRILEIRRLQGQGRMLAEIAQHDVPAEPAAEPWWQYSVAEGVVVSVRASLAPWRLKRIRRAIADLSAKLKEVSDV